MLTNTELFKAITGDAEKLKNVVNTTIKVEEADTVETDKKIAVIKTTDGNSLFLRLETWYRLCLCLKT